MDHDGWDEQWPEDAPDPGDAQTEDLGEPPWLSLEFPGYEDEPGPLDDGAPEPDLGIGDLPDTDFPTGPLDFGAGAGGIDAHVDEPLDADLPSSDQAGFGPAPDAAPTPQPEPALVAEPDPPFGTDPDTDPLLDADGWGEASFPPTLDLGPLPEPIDGPPWMDAALLGEAVLGPPQPGGAPPAAELYDYAGLDAPPPGADPWAALASHEDPATSALARWWAAS